MCLTYMELWLNVASNISDRKWISDAYNYWNDLRLTAEASVAGVTELSGYIFSTTSPHMVRVCGF